MYKSDLDQRTKEDILDYIEKTSAQYVPEWRFDRENPDAGTALASVYADMFVRMLGKFNRMMDKNRISFFNSIGAQVLPPVPASGYVAFGLANDEVEGSPIESGMGVYADTEDGEVAFSTEDDVYATPAKIEEIYQVWDQKDLIQHVYTRGEEQPDFALFDPSGENLQQHEMLFCHDQLLDIEGEAVIELELFVHGGVSVPAEQLRCFLDEKNAVFEYYTANGFERIRPELSERGCLVFRRKDYDPPFARTELEGVESCFIRCRIFRMEPFERFSFESFYMTVKSGYIEPDVIIGNGIECSPTEYLPFGERFNLYNEVYFACREALTKPGSQVQFVFSMDFVRIPLSDDNESNIDWKWLMKKEDFVVDPEYDLTIEEVIWEYYNGNGWGRLFEDNASGSVFSTAEGLYSQYRVLRFTCPEDMVPVLVNSCESCYIRARVLKINNLYKNRGYYVSPVLSDTAFSYDYGRNMKRPQWIFTRNNLETRAYRNGTDPENGYLKPFQMMDMRENALYIGFGRPLREGPVKILFAMMENQVSSRAGLRWEYYSSRGFTGMNLVDETGGFSRTGVVTMMGCPDFRKTSFFGRELYWIRVIDESGTYSRAGADMVYPRVQGIYMNAVRVSNVDYSEEEFFSTERYEENKRITLLHPYVIDVSVWVDEGVHAGDRQLRELEQRYETERVYDAEGILTNVWVKWEETPDFIGMDGQSRCYAIDRNAGVITFGDGRYGKIIQASRQENIRVRYRCGGGRRSNIEPFAISRMAYSTGFVNSVTNPQKILGGCDQETLAEAVGRTSQILKNHYRAVTKGDFEQLAMCASRNISRAVCFTGYDGQGRKSPGAVTLVILQNEFRNGRYVFEGIKNEVMAYMRDKVDGQLLSENRLFIVEPQFVEVCVRLELTVTDFNSVFRLKKEIETRLDRFLHPLTGHFDGNGWKMGTLPSVIQIQNLLHDVRGVKYIKNVFLSLYVMNDTDRSEVEPKEIMKHPYILPAGGHHDIIMKME